MVAPRGYPHRSVFHYARRLQRVFCALYSQQMAVLDATKQTHYQQFNINTMKHNTTPAAAAKMAAAAPTTTTTNAAPVAVLRTPTAAHKRAAADACAACADATPAHVSAVACMLATYTSMRAAKASRAGILAAMHMDADAWHTLRTAYAAALRVQVAADAADAAAALNYANTLTDAWKRLRKSTGYAAMCARVDAAYPDVYAFVYACTQYANADAAPTDADAVLRPATYAVVLDADTDAPRVFRVRALVPRRLADMRDAAAVLTGALARFIKRVGKYANAKTDAAAATTANTYAVDYVAAVVECIPTDAADAARAAGRDVYTDADGRTYASVDTQTGADVAHVLRATDADARTTWAQYTNAAPVE